VTAEIVTDHVRLIQMQALRKAMDFGRQVRGIVPIDWWR
jgi:hypothetical protein